MSRSFTLITGRTAEQGRALHKGKRSEEYRRVTAILEMNSEDSESLGLSEGQPVRVKTAIGETVLVLQIDQQLPPGMLFVPMGPFANRLIGPETVSSGMPHFKGLFAEVEAV